MDKQNSLSLSRFFLCSSRRKQRKVFGDLDEKRSSKGTSKAATSLCGKINARAHTRIHWLKISVHCMIRFVIEFSQCGCIALAYTFRTYKWKKKQQQIFSLIHLLFRTPYFTSSSSSVRMIFLLFIDFCCPFFPCKFLNPLMSPYRLDRLHLSLSAVVWKRKQRTH